MTHYHLTPVSKADQKNYAKAVAKELTKIEKANLPFKVYDYTAGLIKKGDIRLKKGFTPVVEGDYTLENTTYRGVSPKDAYADPKEGVQFITLLQYLRLIQEYPDFLKEKLYLDFAADELRSDGEWSRCPGVIHSDSVTWLGSYWAGSAYVYYGSFVCAWESARPSTLEPLKSLEPLTIELSEITVNGKVYILKEKQ